MRHLIWKGNVIEQCEEDNYVCLHQMAKIFDKDVLEWICKDAKYYCPGFLAETGIKMNEMMRNTQGGNDIEYVTWVHPILAILFAKWVSPEFHIWSLLYIKITPIDQSVAKDHSLISSVVTEEVERHSSIYQYMLTHGYSEMVEMLLSGIERLEHARDNVSR